VFSCVRRVRLSSLRNITQYDSVTPYVFDAGKSLLRKLKVASFTLRLRRVFIFGEKL